VLASDEEGAALDALRFSLASDIVELVVLTADELFLQTLREAVGGARRLWHVPSADKVSDLLVAGGVGILVLDVDTLNEGPSVFIGQIKRQFPDLVVVVAGNRDAETALAGLISAGTVYRFIHKPMSPARAKLFADAAVRKYEGQRKRAAAPPPVHRRSQSNRGVLIGGAVGALGAIVLATWALHRSSEEDLGPPQTAGVARPSEASPILAQAAAALAANRLTEPAGGSAFDLYSQAQAQNPTDAAARAGLAEVHERLLARAENAMLEERLDEASAAIATARNAGADAGRITFLTAQLAKSREQVKTALAAVRVHNELKADADKVAKLGAALEAEKVLAARLLTDAHAAIDARDFARASDLIEAAKGIAAATDVEAARGLLAGARLEADAAAYTQLLNNGTQRLQQDRLIEPNNDSAKYYLLTLRGVNPSNPGLAAAMQDLGTRLVAKARRALVLEQYDAARSWLEEAAAIGFASPETSSAQHELDAAVLVRKFLANVVAAGDLTLLKSVKPAYPKKATLSKTEGWVELDFTVAESGAVKDIAIHATSAPGVFEEAAISALSKWRYKPILRDAAPSAQRARIRIRFVLAD